MEGPSLYIFVDLYSELKNLTTTLNALPEPISFSDLQALLSDHESINENHITPPTSYFSVMQPFEGSYSHMFVSLGGGTSLGQTSNLTFGGFNPTTSPSCPFLGTSLLGLQLGHIEFRPI